MAYLSIIVPLSKDERCWPTLLKDLQNIPQDWEILLIATDQNIQQQLLLLDNQAQVRCIIATSDRGQQMNYGVTHATGNYFWFLHADSRISAATIKAVASNIYNNSQDAIWYADLSFYDGGWYMIINSIGAWFRSRVFKLPFGDQGLCLSRKTFIKLVGYPEDVPYGEDHLLIWRAKQQRIKIMPLQATIATSSRKYQKFGWLKITCLHQLMWVKQAWPQFIKYLMGS